MYILHDDEDQAAHRAHNGIIISCISPNVFLLLVDALRLRSKNVSDRKYLSYIDRMIYTDDDAALVCCKQSYSQRYLRRSRLGGSREKVAIVTFLSWIFSLC